MNNDKDIKCMTVKEFREGGFLQEVNRLILHRLGIALEVTLDEDSGEETLGRIWDYRDDPEGILFTEEIANSDGSREKVEIIEGLLNSKKQARYQTGLCAKSGVQKIKDFED